MTGITQSPAGYRPCVGLFLLNRRGEIFIGHRNDIDADFIPASIAEKPWQMPQGGIDADEDPLAAALRELLEEVGTNRVTLLRQSPHWRLYEFPPEIAKGKWNGKYRGQAQKWFALQFDGIDADININTEKPEFSEWKWIGIDHVCDLIVGFKRQVYASVVNEFRDLAVAAQHTARV